MSSITKTQAIKKFLTAFTHADLAELYSHDQEVQVNVSREDGNRIEIGEFKGRGYNAYTNGVLTWKPFRIPFNARTEPSYHDSPLTYPLELYADGIGMTGWDWANKCSRWVAFDFDAIVGHSDKHGKKLDDKQLQEIQDTVADVPFVTLRKSTSGKGLHLYVFLDPVVSTANHTEHAALARSILSMLSGLTSFDFASKVDTCGANMWVWHRKMYTDWTNRLKGDGLQLIKSGTKLSSVPANWRDHVGVVTQKSPKTIPEFVYNLGVDNPDKLFNELCGQRARVTLDTRHRELIDWLAANGACWWWDSDNHMLVTHTYHLKEAHTQLKLCGKFETIATGALRGNDHNCYAFPTRNGGWVVRRYSIGTKEHDTWDTDKSGWTYCHYNREPDIHTLARTNGGVEHEKGHYCFRTAEAIKTVLLGLGITIELPPFTLHRRATLKPIPTENKIVVHIDADANDDAAAMAGWINEKKLWKRLFKIGINHAAEIESSSSENFDDVVRHIVTQQGQDAGWLLRKESTWVDEPLVHVRAALAALDRSPKEINSIVGSSVLKAWTLVVKPFQPEYPGNREWNRNAPQLAMSPTQDTERLSFPTWGKMLKHVGSSLDPAVTTHEWCRANGIATGADFLMLWIASLLRRPELPLTYLAFWGDQDSGKSVFHEAIGEILLTCGCVRADQALQNQQGFNSEFVNTILAIVEETDLTRNKTAYNRIKDWTTSPEIMIHPKHGTPYMTRNMLHFVQTANEIEACPIFPGDTRITLIHVPVLTEVIPKPQFKALLRKEAPDFLAAIMMMDLPESESRLAVPTIETASKSRATEKNMSALELFLKEEVYERDGHSVLAEDFYNKMQLWLADKDEKDRGFWTKARIGRELPERFPRGRFGSVQLVSYGNMTFDKDAEPKDQKYMPSETRLFMRLVPTKLPEAKQPETTT